MAVIGDGGELSTLNPQPSTLNHPGLIGPKVCYNKHDRPSGRLGAARFLLGQEKGETSGLFCCEEPYPQITQMNADLSPQISQISTDY